MADVVKNVLELRATIDKYATTPVTIMAVTKYHTVEEINQLRQTEIRLIGENRVQDLVAKMPQIDACFNANIIGQLQRNKVKYIIKSVSMIQSVDRVELAQEIDRQAQKAGVVMPVLIQVNLAREPQKGGVLIEDYDALISTAAALPGIRVSGLMAVMPKVDDAEEVRPLFRKMRELFDAERVKARSGVNMEVLSMGMSADYAVAVQEGATMVRVGGAIFA